MTEQQQVIANLKLKALTAAIQAQEFDDFYQLLQQAERIYEMITS